MSKQTVLGVFRFAGMFLLNISKGYEQKNCPRYSQIRKYVSFKYLKKGMSKKTVRGIFRLVSMLFHVIIF